MRVHLLKQMKVRISIFLRSYKVKDFILDVLYWILIVILIIIMIPVTIVVIVLMIVFCIVMAPLVLLADAFGDYNR